MTDMQCIVALVRAGMLEREGSVLLCRLKNRPEEPSPLTNRERREQLR